MPSPLKSKKRRKEEFASYCRRHQARIIREIVNGEALRAVGTSSRSHEPVQDDHHIQKIVDEKTYHVQQNPFHSFGHHFENQDVNTANTDCCDDNCTRSAISSIQDEHLLDLADINETINIHDEELNEKIKYNLDESSDSDSSHDREERGSDALQSALSDWVKDFNINHNAVNGLLQILRIHVPNCLLPKDARTLLQTPRELNIVSISDGQYLHFGLESALLSFMQQYVSKGITLPEVIKLSFNIDGLPISRSSTSSFWPILVLDSTLKSIRMIGVYYGKKKPTFANQLLEKCVKELKTVLNEGFVFEKRKIRVALLTIVCDAPAKSFVLYTKGHNGFSSCSKCTIVGMSINKTTCFPYEDQSSPLRTDQNFIDQTDEEYHRGTTILTEIPNIGLVTNITLDYMHLVCLGSVRKLILLWMKGPLRVRIGNNAAISLSNDLTLMRTQVPSEFARKPRGLDEIHNWKATEFRQFLLYTGPFILKSVLKDEVYTHFLTLHVAISILVSPLLVEEESNIDYADALLKYFVKNFGPIYGDQYVSHNIHNLLHLSNDVRNFGALDNFSAFPFENFLGVLKKVMRKPEKPLQQLGRRYGEQILSINSEKLLLSDTSFMLQKDHSNGPLLLLNNENLLKQYKILKVKHFRIDCEDTRNNCVLLKDDCIFVCLNIIKIRDHDLYIVGKKCKIIGELYNRPCSSQLLSIVKVCIMDQTLYRYRICEIKHKMCKFGQSESEFYVIPLRHNHNL